MIDLAHIHPMLVHFPIVLFLLAVGLLFFVLARGGDLTAQQCLSEAALVTLLLGALSAVVAAIFGDMALDKALGLGFPKSALEEHEDLGFSTMWFFIALSAIYIFAWWRRFSLRRGRGWVMFLAGLAGIALLLVTAYQGGDLVYRLGVNVLPVKP
jgi:uncharacterized membrane protein